MEENTWVQILSWRSYPKWPLSLFIIIIIAPQLMSDMK